LTGARQTGKTTLVRHLLPELPEQQSLYLNFDDPDERLRVGREPVGVLDRGYSRVVIDEVQKLPRVLDAVKLIADRGTNTRFILLGYVSRKAVLAIEAKLSNRIARQDARNVSALLRDRDAQLPRSPVRIGLVVYRGREVQELQPNVWAVPDWMLFASVEQVQRGETRPRHKK